MKKILPAAAAAVFALGIGFAAPASADEDGYLTDLANHDFTGPSQEALTLGYQICTDIQHGVPQTPPSAIYKNTGEHRRRRGEVHLRIRLDLPVRLSHRYRYCPRFDSVSMARLADELFPVTSVRM
jgi:hypothetical protein